MPTCERVSGPRGDLGTVEGAPEYSGGITWVRVAWDDGERTWSRADLLDPNPIDPGAEGDEDEDEPTIRIDPGEGAE